MQSSEDIIQEVEQVSQQLDDLVIAEVAQDQEKKAAQDEPMWEGCDHYRRACMKKCEECKEYFQCRLCHDDVKSLNEADPLKAHKFDRFSTKEIKCNICDTEQPPSQQCTCCSVIFARYYCENCKLWEDNIGRLLYHCDKCGICRAGGRENAVHCDTCGGCVSKAAEGIHKCLADNLKQDCPICVESLFSSRDGGVLLKCGHPIHTACYNDYVQAKNTECPVCRMPFK
ncbi:hypothetical protein FGO68_gene5505 [Halteria grandinella]|uniref:Uncharacterized protein n=1 Tax=Halteria grandinella TaxID=5974 RepID=A0A8J8NJT1_HALGN|nr:hypothetical protein FGO68_gene5505 [Halteria grandinella]